MRLSLQFARLPYQKRIEDFDFKEQPAIDKRLIEELATLRFLSEGRNVVLLGPPGVGKTHLAIGLGMLTAEAGHRVYFTTAIDLARRMAKAMADNRLSREINTLIRPKLLIVDEVGYLSLEAHHASLLFQAICERYERKQPIVLSQPPASQATARSPLISPARAGSSLAGRFSASVRRSLSRHLLRSRSRGRPAPSAPVTHTTCGCWI